ncbi:WxL domain-containing protein [Listeria sp. PSOL-1]|uniref:WxL domain-containing protein n=1 Tax=Listeria sp. PSOL-1 TaxID=1844999 RepID=UPI0013D15599|nr:WxL domain-containing protein [Listeria sp. PSOL-1]
MKKIKGLVASVIAVSGVALFHHVALADDSSSTKSTGSIEFTQSEAGALTLDHISKLSFGNQKTSGSSQVYYATLDEKDGKSVPNFVQVTDKRGSNAGWHLTVTQDAQFANGTNVLTGAVLKLDKGILISEDDGLAPTINQAISLTPGVASDVINAKSEQGTGIWVGSFGSDNATGEKAISLTVPGKTKKVKGEYSASLTWNLTDSPA